MASMAYDEKMCEKAINWILQTQKSDGSWGFHNFSTAEETAYCIQALHKWNLHSKKINKHKMVLAKNWLEKNSDMDHPPMWMDKSLYCPERVVQSVILTALSLVKEY
jgi:halimadienyl-diphosphate synthase